MRSEQVTMNSSGLKFSFFNVKNSRNLWAYGFIFPQLIFFAVLTIYPIIMSYVYSFYNYNGLGKLTNFVGFANYAKLLSTPLYWKDFAHSLEYMAGQTIVVMPLALLMAILLNEGRFRGKTFYRTLYFLPVVTTTAIIGVIMSNIFGDNNALLNEILMFLGVIKTPIHWLDHPNSAMLVLILVGSWKFFGIVMIYWLAGLQSFSKDLFEAAKIDGADFWLALRYITLPLLKPISAVILLLTVVNGLYAFDLIQTLTGGGPYFGTETVDLYIYQYAFGSSAIPQMGYASAGAILFGIAVFFITIMIGLLIRRLNREK